MRILATSHLKDGALRQDGRIAARSEGAITEVFRGLYHALHLDHPKFHKMDLCSKAALLVVEHLVDKAREFGADVPERTGLLAINATGSNVTDASHWEAYQNSGTASPGIFVYTLANIPNGEIGIRHGMYGSAWCLQSYPIKAEDVLQSIRMLMERHGMQHVICHRSDIFADRYDARAVLIGAGEGGIPADLNTISNTIAQDDPWIAKH